MSQTIGIVGGMSPESTIVYYREIVHRHEEVCGDHEYPRIVIASVSFQQYIDWQHQDDWDRIADGLSAEFRAVANAGANFAILATNTMHKVLPSMNPPLPVLHVVDAVAAHARERGVTTVGLTGTRFTMSDGFYQHALEEHGLAVVLPTPEQQAEIHEIIYSELIRGTVTPNGIERFQHIGESLLDRGAESVLLACTELEMLTAQSPLPLIDTTRVHAHMAWAIATNRCKFPRTPTPTRPESRPEALSARDDDRPRRRKP